MALFDVFSSLPGGTTLIEHRVHTPLGTVVISRLYRLPEHKEIVVQEELGKMMSIGVKEESQSDRWSLIMLAPKSDGSL